MLHFFKPAVVAMASLICSLGFTGCVSDKAAKDINREFVMAFSAPLVLATAFTYTDLIYCSRSFRKKTERWPKDYAELSNFVQQSNGYLWLDTYERVDLAQLPEDVLAVSLVPRGSTNEIKFRLKGDVTVIVNKPMNGPQITR